jgi:hypothetical protein
MESSVYRDAAQSLLLDKMRDGCGCKVEMMQVTKCGVEEAEAGQQGFEWTGNCIHWISINVLPSVTLEAR